MKELISILCFLLHGIAFCQIPNSGFESWTIINGVEEPDSWKTNNSIFGTVQPGRISVTKTLDSHSGNYALNVINNGPSIEGPLPGHATAVFIDSAVSKISAYVKCDSIAGTGKGIISISGFTGSSHLEIGRWETNVEIPQYIFIEMLLFPLNNYDSLSIRIEAYAEMNPLGFPTGYASFTVDQLTALETSTISGTILTETGVPVPGVEVALSGDDSQTTTTRVDGRYSFTVAQGGTYTVTPSKNNDLISNNGVTGLDVLIMLRHILNILPPGSPYRIIAADVDSSGTVTTQDVLLTRIMILQNNRTFPNGRLWSFVPSGYVFADVLNPFPFPASKTYTNIQQSSSNQNFIGIKLGDVNNSWNAAIP